MPFSHNEFKITTGIYRYTAVNVSQVNKHTLSYRLLNGNVHGCVFAKNRPVSLNWPDYIRILFNVFGARSDSQKSYGYVVYCKFGNFCEDFFSANSFKRYFCHFKNSRLGHGLPTSINDRVV